MTTQTDHPLQWLAPVPGFSDDALIALDGLSAAASKKNAPVSSLIPLPLSRHMRAIADVFSPLASDGGLLVRPDAIIPHSSPERIKNRIPFRWPAPKSAQHRKQMADTMLATANLIASDSGRPVPDILASIAIAGLRTESPGLAEAAIEAGADLELLSSALASMRSTLAKAAAFRTASEMTVSGKMISQALGGDAGAGASTILDVLTVERERTISALIRGKEVSRGDALSVLRAPAASAAILSMVSPDKIKDYMERLGDALGGWDSPYPAKSGWSMRDAAFATFRCISIPECRILWTTVASEDGLPVALSGLPGNVAPLKKSGVGKAFREMGKILRWDRKHTVPPQDDFEALYGMPGSLAPKEWVSRRKGEWVPHESLLKEELISTTLLGWKGRDTPHNIPRQVNLLEKGTKGVLSPVLCGVFPDSAWVAPSPISPAHIRTTIAMLEDPECSSVALRQVAIASSERMLSVPGFVFSWASSLSGDDALLRAAVNSALASASAEVVDECDLLASRKAPPEWVSDSDGFRGFERYAGRAVRETITTFYAMQKTVASSRPARKRLSP